MYSISNAKYPYQGGREPQILCRFLFWGETRLLLSGFLAGKVWHSALHPDLKPLAASLADIANDDGTSIYPSVAHICWLLGRSERSVQINLARLRDMGILQVIKYGRGGRHKATHYRLIEDMLPSRPRWQNPAVIAGYKNPAVYDKKPRSLQQTTVLPVAPEPSVEPSVIKHKPRAQPRSARNRFDEQIEQKRRIEAKLKREQIEAEGYRAAMVGDAGR